MALVRDIRDIALHYAATTSPSFQFRCVAPAGRSVQRAPPFLLGPARGENLCDIFGELDTPAAGCYAIEDATVAPTGFPIKDGVALHGAPFLHPRHHVVCVSDRLNADELPVRHVPGPLAVICGPAHETWGHWLTDFLPRLWVLQAAGYRLGELRFLLPPDLRPFAWKLLELLGIGPAQCDIYNHWREIISTDFLLLPTGLRTNNRFATCFREATCWWTSAVRTSGGISPGQDRLVFVSRGSAPQDRLMSNRKTIEAMAQAAGFLLISPESLSIPQQVALFAGASVIIGEYGSALHNSVFAAPGALVCGLRGTSRHPSFVQSGIATALGQGSAYVFGDTAGQDVKQRFPIQPRLFGMALEMVQTAQEGSRQLFLEKKNLGTLTQLVDAAGSIRTHP